MARLVTRQVRNGCPGSLPPATTRREFLKRNSNGFGLLALAGLMADRGYAGLANRLSPTNGDTCTLHHTPRAKRVIFLFMDGGPSHVDTFDYKPALEKYNGKAIGEQAVSTLSQSNPRRVWLGSPWNFERRGDSGLWVSELLPHIGSIADELCVVRSLVGRSALHGQQNYLLHTGRDLAQAPSMGSWISYGLGTENENLPGYAILNNDWIPNGGQENFSSAFLPARHGATQLRARGAPVDDLHPVESLALQRRKLDLLRTQDQEFARRGDPGGLIDSAIQNYELAFRLQTSIPDAIGVDDEPESIKRLYGLDSQNEYQSYYALQCLRARRLVERGVRFVEVLCPLTHKNNSPWDQHSQLVKYHNENALVTDQSVTALILDLKARGLLDETIVMWAGEMGRTPHTSPKNKVAGRDHHVDGYTIFLAGGGFKGGIAYGDTDDFGNTVVNDRLEIHDIHATILHQLGIDHERLTYRFGGRDVSLTDVHGRVVTELLV